MNKSFRKRFHGEESSTSLAEYVLLITLIVIAVIAGLQIFGSDLLAIFQRSAG